MFLHFAAPVFCLLWLTKYTVDSVKLSAPEEVTAAYGGSVTVSCRYDHQFREHTKYWCKGPIYELCTIVVKTPKQRPSERSSISDDKDAGVFTVTMTSLKESDENMYWCVISRHGKNIYTGVRLVVSHTGILRHFIRCNTMLLRLLNVLAFDSIDFFFTDPERQKLI